MAPGFPSRPKSARARVTLPLVALGVLAWPLHVSTAQAQTAEPRAAEPRAAELRAAEPRAAEASRPEPSEEDLSAARQKFQRALSLQTGGDWASALALLKEVAEVRPTPQVLFNVALCEENLGQLVAALGTYELAAADARAAGLSMVEGEAMERLEQLRVRIPRLLLQRSDGAAHASVTLGGVALGEAALGRQLPVDPGSHEIRAVAKGQTPFVKQVRLEEGQQLTVTIEFETKATEPPEPAAAASAPAQRVAGYVTGAVGLASLAAAGVFYVLRYNALQDLDELCPSRSSCPAEGRDIRDRGERFTTYGNVSLGVGVVGVATAAVLLLTEGAPREDASRRWLPRRGILSFGHASATLGATYSGTF